jgi:RNA polymerase sigma factor (sigma-70 family)
MFAVASRRTVPDVIIDDDAEPCIENLRAHAYRVALSFFGGDVDRADEVAQESLARALTRWSHVASHPNPVAWISTTARYVCLELCRPSRRHEQLDPMVDEASPIDMENGAADREAVLLILACLSPHQRQVVVWRFFFGCTVRETAEQLGMKESAVKDATHEGMTKIRRLHASLPINAA